MVLLASFKSIFNSSSISWIAFLSSSVLSTIIGDLSASAASVALALAVAVALATPILFINISLLYLIILLVSASVSIGLTNIPSLYRVIYLFLIKLFGELLGYTRFLIAYINISLSIWYPILSFNIAKSIYIFSSPLPLAASTIFLMLFLMLGNRCLYTSLRKPLALIWVATRTLHLGSSISLSPKLYLMRAPWDVSIFILSNWKIDLGK